MGKVILFPGMFECLFVSFITAFKNDPENKTVFVKPLAECNRLSFKSNKENYSYAFV